MMQHCRTYRDIARKLIQTLPEFEELKDAAPRVAYLESDKEKVKNHRAVLGECCKVDEKYSWCCDYDFFIVVYGPNVENFNDKQIETLIRHELHHIGITYTDNGIDYFVRPHDVEEFYKIIDDCGLYWSDTNATGR